MKLTVALVGCALTLVASLSHAQNCSNTSVGFTPIDDLGAGLYQGQPGGLYPGGANTRPIAHEVGGLAQVTQVVPRNAAGAPDPNGRIVVMSLGMSNCVAHWGAFQQSSNADPLRDSRVFLFQGAQGGAAAASMDQPTDAYWTTVLPQKLQQAGVQPAEVQVIWFLQANAQPTASFPQHAQGLQSQMAEILRIARDTLPNLRIVYCASRIYAGYATTSLNPEPWAYEQAFAVKWLIEDQIDGDPALNYDAALGPVEAPWIAWGPYMWADGLVPRSDGLTWLCSDLQPDGTHPSPQGTQKNAGYLLDFFQNDTSARTWYRAEPEPVIYGTGKLTSINTVPEIDWSGAPVVGPANFTIRLTGAVPQHLAIGFHGLQPSREPFFGGTLWIRPPLVRLPPRMTNANGATSYSIAIDPAMVGLTDHFGFWFRDGNHPDGTGVGMSNAMQVRYR